MASAFLLPVGRPALMGILNVTPDSFSDGGLFLDANAAVDRGCAMIDEGADIVDVGGESTRPGAAPVDEDEEFRRVIPVVEALASKGVPISVDTSKPGVALRALEAGAKVVNDVTALRSDGMAEVCAEHGCTVCLMHMKGEPRTMQTNPIYENVIAEVKAFLLERANFAETRGVRKDRIWIDPGIGFGKAVSHNLALLRNLESLVESGYPVLVGVSRKSFLGRLLGSDEAPLPADQRLEGTLAAQVLAQAKGARIIRAHDAKEARTAIDVSSAILAAIAD